MGFLTIFFIAVGLSMDAFAVAITSGTTLHRLHLKHILRMAFFFGFFQALMPLLGWLLGQSLTTLVSRFAHWIAFVILLFVGIKTIYEALHLEDVSKTKDLMAIQTVLILALATSIDAFAVGVSFSMLKVDILFSAGIIGMVTFVLSFIGTLIGEKIGSFFENKIEIISGLILIAIGIKIILEHYIL